MLYKLDRNNPLPFYQQLRDLLRERIASGRLRPNDAIPDERALAAELRLSRMTVRRAIMDLTREGLFHRVRGRGTFVSKPRQTVRKSTRALTLAVVAPFAEADVHKSLFYYRILEGVQEAAGEVKATVAFYQISGAPEDFAASLTREATPSGLIVLGIVEQRVLKALARVPLPLVLVDSSQPEGGKHFDSVCHRGEGSVCEAVKHLIRLGHRDIGLMNYVPLTPAGRERQAGYTRALKEHEIAARPEFYYPVECDSAAAYAAMRRALEQGPVPTACFCTTDELAIGVIEAAKDCGLRVPSDMSVVGFGDLGYFTSPSLSSIRIPVKQMGLRAVEVLCQRIQSPSAPANIVAFPTEFVSRGSCDCPRPAHRSS